MTTFTETAGATGPVVGDQRITKVSIIVSKGSLEGIHPALILANGARMEGTEANVFFTFFGMDAINKARHEHIKVATVGNPALHLATWLGGVPGIASFVTQQMMKSMEKLDIPPIPEFIEMFDLTREDFIDAIEGIITVGDFYQMAGGGQIIFT